MEQADSVNADISNNNTDAQLLARIALFFVDNIMKNGRNSRFLKICLSVI
jgi:hypothetical protein